MKQTLISIMQSKQERQQTNTNMKHLRTKCFLLYFSPHTQFSEEFFWPFPTGWNSKNTFFFRNQVSTLLLLVGQWIVSSQTHTIGLATRITREMFRWHVLTLLKTSTDTCLIFLSVHHRENMMNVEE